MLISDTIVVQCKYPCAYTFSIGKEMFEKIIRNKNYHHSQVKCMIIPRGLI